MEKLNSNFVDDYIILDTETTGLYDDKDKIIEIGALKYKNNKLVAELQVIINPEIPIPPIITNITGLTDDIVKKGEKLKDILPRFLAFIENYPIICHNVPFDLGFVNQALLANHLPKLGNQTIDTIDLAKIYIPKAYNYKLETLKHYFKLDFGSHRSIEDCKTTNAIYQECKKRATMNV